MKRLKAIQNIRKKLRQQKPSIGSWIQIPHPSIAEILGQAGYDWVAIDMEHGSVSPHQLPDLFRALELGRTLPLVRLGLGHPKDCKQALDAGAGGVIVPMIENAEQLQKIRDACYWPPAGNRGVGFSRANMFGKHFDDYKKEAQAPMLVAQIEQIRAVENLEGILSVEGLDAILIGPYDLSASMGCTGRFDDPTFRETMRSVLELCRQHQIPSGIHIVQPDSKELQRCILEGYLFIAYSLDSVFLHQFSSIPEV